MGEIEKEIALLSEENYADFSKKLIPGTGNILGLRAPLAKKIAKKYAYTLQAEAFLASLPHKYHDENMVHAYMLAHIQDFDTLIKFLPYVSNWAVCDSLCASIKWAFKDRDSTLSFLLECLNSKMAYTIRFALVCLLDYYVEEKYMNLLLSVIKETKSEEYYVNMALAWLISVMLVKEYATTLPLIKNGILPLWVHNKSIQKACESYRIDEMRRTELKSLRRKI